LCLSCTMSDCGVYVPIWQWAEDNQGLLSVLALAAALGVAAYEFIQARRAERRRKGEYIDVVSGILSMLADKLDSVANGNQIIDIWSVWRRAESSISVIRPSAPADADLALTLAEVAEYFLSHVPNPNTGPDNYEDRAYTARAFQARVEARRRVR
jgi:hypothetical protein